MKYKHLSLEERHYIDIELKNKSSINNIAKASGSTQGTISKEIQRNTGKRGYRHKQANSLALHRLKNKPFPTKMTADTIANIEYMLINNQWSPQQIAGRLKIEKGYPCTMKPSIVTSLQTRKTAEHSTNTYDIPIKHIVSEVAHKGEI